MKKFKKIILKSSGGKKSNNIIYCNNRFTDESIRGLVHFVTDNTRIERVVFLTEKEKYEEYYELFEEVMYFPTIKKVHILECEQYKNPMFRWVNDLNTQSHS